MVRKRVALCTRVSISTGKGRDWLHCIRVSIDT